MLVIFFWPPSKGALVRCVHDLREERAVQVHVIVACHAFEDRHLELARTLLELHGVSTLDQVGELHVDSVVVAHGGSHVSWKLNAPNENVIVDAFAEVDALAWVVWGFFD